MNTIGIIAIVISSLIFLIVLSYFFIGEISYSISLKRSSVAGKFIGKDMERKWIKRLKIDLSWWETNLTERVEISSKPKLVGRIRINNPKKFVILVHGYMADYKSMQTYAKAFQDFGFSFLCTENRAHGESEGKSAGMGWLDKNDLKKWIKYLIKTYGEDIEIVLFGVSMGGATVCMTSGLELPENVKCIISDCAYDNVLNQFEHVAKSYMKIPPKIALKILDSYAEIRAGYRLQDADAVKQVKKTKVPILFIHGTKDSFVPCYMVENLYNATPENLREKYIVEGAEHSECHAKDFDKYNKVVENFINKYLDN